MATRNLRVVPTVMPPAPLPQQQGPIPSPAGWVWDGANWVCDQPPAPCQPWPCPPSPCPPCTDEFPPMPPGCPPWFPPPSGQAPWYPGANGGVSFSQDAPSCPVRGHFWFDGKVLWLFDGAAWVDVGLAGISTLFQSGSAPVFVGITAPPAAAPGALWWNGTILQLWDGVKWNFIGPTTMPAPTVSGLIAIDFYPVSQLVYIPANATKGWVQLWGGTGGSGGVNNAESAATGAAGYLEKYLSGLTPGNTLSLTVGAAGAAGAVNSAGGAGGASVLSSGSQSIGVLTANGSLGTPAGVTSSGVEVPAPGSPGGTATGGDINVTGQDGESSWVPSTSAPEPQGGQTFFSDGADGVNSNSGQAGNPGNPGGCKISWFA